MRMLVVLGLLAACDKGKAKKEELPAPQAQLMETVADGVMRSPPPVDAAVAAGPVISRAGVGTLGKLEWWKLDNEEIFKRMRTGIPLPGATASFDVMELPFVEETEEGYFSMKRGEEELLQVLRTHDDKPASVVVWSPEIPTSAGIRVGDKVDALIAKRPDVACTVDMFGTFIGMIAVYIDCASPAEPEIRYFVDPGKQTFKNGKIDTKKLTNLAIVGIGHAFVGS
jgi:hypothetical protein